ncbi:recombinase RecT [Paenibacillus jamilae]|nr:recombinase RecT [Paenibacillus jamilae]
MANTNNQLTIYDSYAFGTLTQEDVKTVHQTIAKDCNESQFRLFMGVAKAADANPLIGEIYPTVYQGKLTWQFGIDYHIRKAKEMDGYMGYDVQVIHENDEFEYSMERAEDGRYYLSIEKYKGGFPLGKPIGGYAMAYKEGFMPFSVLMDIEEVEHYKKSAIGMQKTMWTNNFKDMFKKHMVKRALKAAFGLRFDDGDGEQGEGPAPYNPYERKDITPETDVTGTVNPGNKQPNGTDPEPKVSPLDQARDEMKKKFSQLGITDPVDMQAYILKHANPKGDKPSLPELKGLLKIMDMHLAEKAAQEQANDELPL